MYESGVLNKPCTEGRTTPVGIQDFGSTFWIFRLRRGDFGPLTDAPLFKCGMIVIFRP